MDGGARWYTFAELETIMESDPEAKKSKRRRVTGIILKVILAVVVVGLIIIAISSHSSGKALRKELEALRAAGIPTEIEEVFERTIPEDRNAAPTYTIAFARIGGGISKSDLGIPRDPEGDLTEALEDLRRIVAENAKALALLRKAATFPDCYWTVKIRPPAAQSYSQATQPIFSGVRSSARLLKADACVALAEGDTERALADFKACVALSRSLAMQNTLIAKSVQMVVQEETLWVLDRALAEANISAGDGKLLLDTLSELAGSTDLSGTLKGELVFGRACQRDMPGSSIIAGGFFRASETHRLRYMRFVIEAAGKPTWEGLDLVKERHREQYSGPLRKRDMAKMWAHLLSPQIVRAFEQNAGIRAKIEVRRAALMHLAGEEVDIADPFTGAPLFFAETEGGFKFWSVGLDRVNDGGTPAPAGKRIGPDEKGYDIVYELRKAAAP